jgi:hypothetical protein
MYNSVGFVVRKLHFKCLKGLKIPYISCLYYTRLRSKFVSRRKTEPLLVLLSACTKYNIQGVPKQVATKSSRAYNSLQRYHCNNLAGIKLLALLRGSD